MQLAFYKGGKRLFDRMVQWWTRSSYSHCELVLSYQLDSGEAECASSSKLDGGVRIKLIDLSPDRWDLVDLPFTDEAAARDWFLLHLGEDYDVKGLIGFVGPIEGRSKKWFCSEACAAALGYKDPWRYSPAMLAARHDMVGSVIKRA
ncbi:MAG: hypothetical protein ACSHXZ_10010 [Gammaproteobacteria bacterium]